MVGEIILGGRGTKAGDMGKSDVNVTEVFVTRSEYDAAVKGGGTRPAFQLAVRMKSDSGAETTGYYGGLYPNFAPALPPDGSHVPKKARVDLSTVKNIGFGQAGYAREFLVAWAQATGKPIESILSLVGSRFYAEPITKNAGGKTSVKLYPVGPARSAAPAPNAQPAAPAVNLAAALGIPAAQPAAPVQPVIDAAPFWAKLDAGTQGAIVQAAKSNVPNIAKTLVETKIAPDLATAEAIVQHAKGVA